MDERQRELERAAAQGDVEAGARALLARVRAGDLSEERLRLAAFLGHEAAVLACVEEVPKRDHLYLWAMEVGDLGQEISLRVAIAAVHWALVEDADPAERQILGQLEAWALCFCKDCERRARLTAELRSGETSSELLAVRALWACDAEGGEALGELVDHASGFHPGNERLRGAIVREVLPWAMGNGDPVRMRVAARRS